MLPYITQYHIYQSVYISNIYFTIFIYITFDYGLT